MTRTQGKSERDPSERNEHLFQCKVYYEDTDCMSVVYHANYLKFLERARSEFLQDRLAGIQEYHDNGYFFMVHKLELAFHSPARLGDVLVIRTWIEHTTRFRVAVKQIVSRKGEPKDYLVSGTVTLVAVSPDGELLAIPEEFHTL